MDVEIYTDYEPCYHCDTPVRVSGKNCSIVACPNLDCDQQPYLLGGGTYVSPKSWNRFMDRCRREDLELEVEMNHG